MASNINAATKAFFKSGYGVVLAVYDTRRGQAEGREAEKVLAFYPPTAPAAMQSSIVGLAQALTMFAGTFNKECPFHSMEAHRHLWTMYHAEPDLWLLLVVGRALVGPNCLPASLTGLLKGLHGMAVLLHGLISTQLEQDPSAARVRLRLQPLLHEVSSSLLQPDPAGLWALSCPLGLTGGVPLLPVSTAAFTRLQSLVNSLLVSRLFGCRPVQGVLVCWQTCLLWSSLSSSDTAALHSLAVRGLEPAAREGPRHKTWRRPIFAGQHSQTQHNQQQQQPGQASAAAAAAGSSLPSSSTEPPLPQSTRPRSILGSSSHGNSGGGPAAAAAAGGGSSGSNGGCGGSDDLAADFMCLASSASWCCRADGLLLPVWLTGSSGSSEAGAAAAAAAVHGCSELPMVWLQCGSEPARLMAWHSGPLLLLLLLDPHGPAASSCAAVTASLCESLLSGPAAALSAQLSAELPAKHLWHVKGLRYLYQDHLAAAVRASPLRKVATLSAASLHLTAEARRATDLEAAAAADPTAPVLGDTAPAAGTSSSSRRLGGSSGGSNGSSGSSGVAAEAWESFAAGGEDAAVEVVVKGANDCWVVARHTGAGRQLTAVVESEREGLPGVMRRVQGFCDSQCPGVFEGLS